MRARPGRAQHRGLGNGGERQHLAPRAAGRGDGLCVANRSRRSGSIPRGGPPFDLMVGKKLGERVVVSLEYSRELFHDKGFEPYEWQLEGRIGYHF